MRYRHKTNHLHFVTVVARHFGAVDFVKAGDSVVCRQPEADFDRNYEPIDPIAGIPAAPAEPVPVPSPPLPRYKHRITGDVIEVSETHAGTVYYHSQGGGFRRALSTLMFEHVFEPVTSPSPYVRGTVTAEWLLDEETGLHAILPCISNGDRWNGWAMPYFDRDTVNELISLCPDLLRWKDEREYEVVALNTGDEPEEWAPDLLMLADGEQIVEAWGIGAGSWCWEGFEPDPKEAAQMLMGEMDKVYAETHQTCPNPNLQQVAKTPTDTEMLDWLLEYPHVRVRGDAENGYAAMDCAMGLVILAEGETARAAIAAAMQKEQDNGKSKA